jgi:hypothetical protein
MKTQLDAQVNVGSHRNTVPKRRLEAPETHGGEHFGSETGIA